MKSAAAYLRVSTTQQDWKLQRDAVTRAARARGDRIPKRLWFEEKKSGANIARPVLQKLRAAVRAGRVGRLYVFRIDRLTRSGIRDTLGLVEEVRCSGKVISTQTANFVHGHQNVFFIPMAASGYSASSGRKRRGLGSSLIACESYARRRTKATIARERLARGAASFSALGQRAPYFFGVRLAATDASRSARVTDGARRPAAQLAARAIKVARGLVFHLSERSFVSRSS